MRRPRVSALGFSAALLFLFCLWMCAQIPYTHDDWDWGTANGLVYLTTAVQNHIKSFEASFAAGHEIFSGDIKDVDGTYRCRSGEVLSDETLSKAVFWLVDGVEAVE